MNKKFPKFAAHFLPPQVLFQFITALKVITNPVSNSLIAFIGTFFLLQTLPTYTYTKLASLKVFYMIYDYHIVTGDSINFLNSLKLKIWSWSGAGVTYYFGVMIKFFGSLITNIISWLFLLLVSIDNSTYSNWWIFIFVCKISSFVKMLQFIIPNLTDIKLFCTI